MTITISRVYSFQSAHWLPMVDRSHKCAAMHGHSYELTVEVSGDVDPSGWIRDFADVDRFVDPLVARLDHHCLNDIIGNPTCENVAVWFATNLLGDLPDLASVRVAETGRSSAKWLR